MKNKKTLFMTVLSIIGIISVVESCKPGRNCNEQKTSRAGESESHNEGKNCMSCHVSGGKGEGCFTVAGTVYDTFATKPVNSGQIKLHTGPKGSGTVAATIQVDARGNFYTPDAVNFAGGLYPSYTNSAGKTVYMGSSIGMGQCGSCHNVSTGKIVAPQ